MSKSKKESFFWTSYSDLTTSLFFVMLVLFVLVIVLLHKKISEQNILLEEFNKIEEIKKSVNEINPLYFEYSSQYKKHIFRLQVQYPTGDYEISKITNPDLLLEIKNAGQDIQNLIEKFSEKDNIQYLIVIEGQASRDNYHSDNYRNNNVLSYLRALKLKEYWTQNEINFEKFSNCEIVVAGSGEGGIPRDLTNETANQRFLIHIIPKTGVIDKSNIFAP